MSEEKVVTARKELYDHLKYLVGHDDANKMIDEYKEEILNEIDYYEIGQKILDDLKRELIEEINSSPVSFMPILRKVVVCDERGFIEETRNHIDSTEVIKLIKNFKVTGE